MNAAPHYLSLPEVARRLDVDVDTVRSWARSGLIPAVRLPGARGQFRVAETDVALALQPAVGRPPHASARDWRAGPAARGIFDLRARV